MNLPEIIQEIFRDDPALRDEPLASARIDAVTERLDDPAAALAAFLEAPGEGWLTTVEGREVYVFGKGETTEPSPHERPLSGEKADGQASIRLQENGEGGWNLTRFHETEVSPPEGDEPGPVVRESSQLARNPEIGVLRYRVCLEPRQDAPFLEPTRCRFAGFGDA